ncbi:MAG: PqiC family protein [Gammaproteobacteria bacterium]
MNKPLASLWPAFGRSYLIAGCLLSACAATPETHFYVLSALSRPLETSSSEAPRRLIGVGQVSVPSLLERKQIVTHSGGNRIEASELHQWAAPLQASITETLAQNLSALLPNDIIKAYPWSAYGEVDHHIIIDIVRFDVSSERTAELTANWSIMNDRTHILTSHGQTKISRSQTGPEYADAVKALSETLQEFSKQLAVSLVRLKPSVDRTSDR